MPLATRALESTSPVTAVSQLRQLASIDPTTNYSFQLNADIWWVNPAEGRFILHDATGTEQVEFDLAGAPPKAGDRVLLTGTGTIVRRAAALRLGTLGPVITHDGIHSLTEKSGSIYLPAGRHSLRVDWFNGAGKPGLSLEYDGPGLQRQTIPDAAWYRREARVPGGVVHGLEYKCYEGKWTALPDFSRLTPVSTGIATNLNPAIATRKNHVALQFGGLLEVSRAGMYQFHLRSHAGSRLLIGEPTLGVSVVGRAAFPAPAPIVIGQLLPEGQAQWVEVEGTVTVAREQAGRTQLELQAGAGCMLVDVADELGLSAGQWLNRRVRAVGCCEPSFNTDGQRVAGRLLVPAREYVQVIERALDGRPAGAASARSAAGAPLPLLVSAESIRELPPEEARRGYPVQLRGVVTCVEPSERVFVIQDSTMGLRAVVAAEEAQIDMPVRGEFVEIEGVTDQPGIAKVHRVITLGEGILPEPAHPAWDQLMNGSLDAQRVEIGGLIENLIDRSNGWTRVMLRSRAGVLKVDVRQAGVNPGPIEQYENAVVRLRGCVFADWMPDLRLKVGQVKMFNADIAVECPAPADLFSLPATTAAALMRFDPAFDVSRRVKVNGQIVYVRGADYFLMDGRDGLRFMAKRPLGLEVGDLVEAVGYPEISGAAPVLRGAVARKTGHAALPPPRTISSNDLIRANLDATRVRVEGLLRGVDWTSSTNLVLEMQGGRWRFLGKLKTTNEVPLQIGSRIELTGVYCAQGGYTALGADFAPLDVLLNDPADIRVLARTPWWTIRRLLFIVGVLVLAVASMVLWITQLRRQVEERSAELARQVQNRERLEQQRALEQERARIAQDLHDQLGSDIAAVGMLASRAQFASATEDQRSRHLDQVRTKAREMVASLDEIVWAMNPGHDFVSSLESYLGRYAGRFLGLSNVAWHFEAPPATADRPVDSRQRHQLFLAFKEALTNVVRHSGASEVRVTLQVQGDELRLAVADNGCGLSASEAAGEQHGLTGMRARIEKLGGRCEISGEPGRGTTVCFRVPLKETV